MSEFDAHSAGLQAVRPRMDEALKFLGMVDPVRLQELRAQYPGIPKVEDLDLGDKELGLVELRVVAEALERLQTGRQQALHKAEERIKLARALVFAASFIGVISSASIIGVLAQDFPKVMAYAGAFLSLAASVTPLIANHVAHVPNQAGTDLFGLYQKLGALEFEAEMLLPQILHCLADPCSEAKVLELIGKGNSIAADTRKALAELV